MNNPIKVCAKCKAVYHEDSEHDATCKGDLGQCASNGRVAYRNQSFCTGFRSESNSGQRYSSKCHECKFWHRYEDGISVNEVMYSGYLVKVAEHLKDEGKTEAMRDVLDLSTLEIMLFIRDLTGITKIDEEGWTTQPGFKEWAEFVETIDVTLLSRFWPIHQ